MPSANDKVVLSIKLELKEALADLKKVKKEVADLRMQTVKDQKQGQIHLKKQSQDERKLHRERKQRHKELNDTQIKARQEVQKISHELKSQPRMLRDLTKYTDLAKAKWASWKADHPYLTAAGRGIHRPLKLAGRVAGGVAQAGLGALGAVGSGLLGMLMGGIQQGYGTYLQVGAAKAAMAGMGSRTDLNSGRRFLGRGAGGALGYTPTEHAGNAAAIARATGNLGAVYRGEQLTRITGMGIGEAAGVMGAFRQAGLGFETPVTKGRKGTEGAGVRMLEKTMAQAMATGLERARVPEYLHAVAQFADQQGGRQGGTVDVGAIGGALALVSKLTGTTGNRAAGIFSQLNQSIMAPGAGEAGQALTLQAFGFGKPGGTNDYYSAIQRQEQGLTGPEGAKNLLDILKETTSQYGTQGLAGNAPENQERNLVLKEVYGITTKMAEQITDFMQSGDDQETILKKIQELSDKQYESMDKKMLQVNREGFLGVKNRLAKLESQGEALGAKAAKIVETMQDELHRVMLSLFGYLDQNKASIVAGIKMMGEWAAQMIKSDLVKKGVKDTTAVLKGVVEGTKGEHGLINTIIGGARGGAAAYGNQRAKEKFEENKTLLGKANPSLPDWRVDTIEKLRTRRDEAEARGDIEEAKQHARDMRTLRTAKLGTFKKNPFTGEDIDEQGEIQKRRERERREANRATYGTETPSPTDRPLSAKTQRVVIPVSHRGAKPHIRGQQRDSSVNE